MRARILGLAGAAFGLALAFSAPASAYVVLPTGSDVSCGLGPDNNCLYFSDFTVFSLSLLQFQLDGNNKGPNSPDPYYADSSPGFLNENAITIFTGPSGVNNPAGNLDQPYASPNNVPQGALANFAMTPPDPSPLFTGDNAAMASTTVNNNTTLVNQPPVAIGPDGSLPLWDISVNTLKNFLDGDSLDFYFNLNQTKASGDATYLKTPQDLLAFMQVTLTSADGSFVKTFRLDGNNCTGTGGTCDPGSSYAQNLVGVNDFLPLADDRWAYVHGSICVAPDGAVVWLGHCDDPTKPASVIIPAGSKDVDQNLGANNASFATYSDMLNFWLYQGVFAGGTLSVDARLAALNNGFEQLYIIAGQALPPTIVPEPLTITLFGAGLAGVGLLRRRKARKSND